MAEKPKRGGWTRKGYWNPARCLCCNMTDKKAYRKWLRSYMKQQLKKELNDV